MVTEPPSIDKSVETSESISTSPSQADNQLPPKERRPLKLPLEAASDLKTFKPSGISEKQHLCILEEAFRGSEPMFYTIIYYVQRRAASQYLPMK